MRDELGDPAGAAVTCFEVIEHLETFVPLVVALIDLAAKGATVVLSAPNDAFWALENPYHHTMWGEGAFEELRRLLPPDTVVARQVPLNGSHLVVEGDAGPLTMPPVAPRTDAVASHLLCAFGPRAGLLASRALAVPADLDAQRTWERQRESNMAVLQAEFAVVEAEREEFRQHIHKLEEQQGKPTP